MLRAAARDRNHAPRVDYHALADLRYQIRRFLRVREVAAREVGVAPQQYHLLLQVKGLHRREPPTIGVLVAARLAARGMVARRRDAGDRREVLIELRPAGEAALRRLARHSIAELRTEGPALVSSLLRLVRKSMDARTPLRTKRRGGVP